MNTKQLTDYLDSLLTDSKIRTDVYKFLSSERDEGFTLIELNEVWVPIPVDVPVFIISKGFFSKNYDVGFGTYRVLASLGDPVKEKSGGLDSPYCFSTLYYNPEVEMITLDFHKELRYS